MTNNSDWISIRLRELGIFRSNGADKKIASDEIPVSLVNYMDVYKHNRIDGNFIFQKVTAKKSEIEKCNLEKGDLLFTPSSETPDDIGYSAVVMDDLENVVYSYHVVRFRPENPDFFDLNFLSYLLNQYSIRKYFTSRATGITRFTLNKADFENLQIRFPKTIEEQQKIAAILTKVDDAIQAVKNTIEKTERLKKALMQNLLTGKLKPDGTWRRDDEFYEDEKFGKVPVGWSIKKLGNILSFCQYGLSMSMKETGEYPIFRMNNIENGKMVSSPMLYVDLSEDEFEKYKVNKGDILFNRTNSLDLVGKVGIFDLADDYVFASYLIRLTVNENNNPFYINYYLNYFDGQRKIKSKVTPSVSQANINASNLKSILIPVPNEKPEQDKVVQLIKKTENQIDIKNAKIQKLERLKKALMQNLLTGKIRLNLD